MPPSGVIDPCWQDVTRHDRPKYTHPRVVCNYCMKEWNHSAPQRIKDHMRKCQELPKDRWHVYRTGHSGGDPQGKRKAARSFYDTVSEAEEEALNIALAELFYMAGLAFNLVEHPAFRRFLQLLRPAYKPPSRWQLANSLLNEVYNRLKRSIDKLLKQRSGQITLVTDGWTNPRGEAIINYLAVTRTESIFLKNVYTSKDRHTGEYIANGLIEQVEELGRESLTAVTTDNASNMKSSWQVLNVKYPGLLTLGCGSHQTNLMVEDLCKLPKVAETLDRVKEVNTYFKKSAVRVGLIDKTSTERNLPRKAFQLPGKTRWQGKLLTVESCLFNQDVVQAAILDQQGCVGQSPRPDQAQKYTQIRALVLNEEFWDNSRSLRRLLKPFLQVTIALESTKPKASRIYAYYTWLLQETYIDGFLPHDEVITILSNRFNKIYHPLFAIAYLCDPSARESKKVNVTNTQMAGVARYLLQHYNGDSVKAGKVYRGLITLRERVEVFSDEVQWQAAQEGDPAMWWKSLDVNDDLRELAIYSLSINPTTGAAEQNWSTHGFIHSKGRNRLKNERVDKLVYCYTNLRIRDSISKEDSIWFVDEELSEPSDAGFEFYEDPRVFEPDLKDTASLDETLYIPDLGDTPPVNHPLIVVREIR